MARRPVDADETAEIKCYLSNAPANLAIIGAMFTVFMVVGTTLFVRSERNR